MTFSKTWFQFAGLALAAALLVGCSGPEEPATDTGGMGGGAMTGAPASPSPDPAANTPAPAEPKVDEPAPAPAEPKVEAAPAEPTPSAPPAEEPKTEEPKAEAPKA